MLLHEAALGLLFETFILLPRVFLGEYRHHAALILSLYPLFAPILGLPSKATQTPPTSGSRNKKKSKVEIMRPTAWHGSFEVWVGQVSKTIQLE
ncbi:putative cysteine protease RDL6 [Frankliniella fusca]|uniref:Cysteine protease RDL6 n=1 Tax=Frankliniella fusca TaxID=407009 RepID=A0AAE1H0Q4_9NEOP|nr:putative cysteine protease RDL6 [Frankliniella fusca]